jgi:hypothetical protein
MSDEKKFNEEIEEKLNQIDNNIDNDSNNRIDDDNQKEQNSDNETKDTSKAQKRFQAFKSLFTKEKNNNKKPSKKKIYISAVVAVLVATAGYLGIVFEKKISQSNIQKPTLPLQTKTTKTKHQEIAVNTTNNTNSTLNQNNATNSTQTVANPESLLNNKAMAKNTSAIASIPGNKFFDIFSLEPTQEYKLDQIQNYYEKTLEILKLQKDIVKVKNEINDLYQPQQKKTKEETPSGPVIAPPPKLAEPKNTFPNNNNIVPFPSQISNIPNPSVLPPPPGPSFSSTSSGNTGSVLADVSINLIYDFKDKKIAVVQYKNSIFRAGIGEQIAPGYRVERIVSNGVYVNGPEGEAFLPLSFKAQPKNSIVFTDNSHAKTEQGNGMPVFNQSNQPIFHPANISQPPMPAFIGGSNR